MTPEELVALFPHITLAQVYGALSYYYGHKEEIDQDLQENTEEYWQTKLKTSDS
jgi:uncharacterized protein (DUF433 family)